MKFFTDLEQVNFQDTWATIGTYDGVHRGHQVILNSLVQQAHAVGHAAAVISFDPPPAVVLRGIDDRYLLTTPEERADLLASLGVDIVIMLPFTQALAAWSAREFIEQIHRRLGLRCLLEGSNFAFGHGRTGNAALLREMGAQMGFCVQIIDEVRLSDEPASASRIRSLVSAGQVGLAANLLGRFYTLSGEVVHGDGRGRTMDLRTANVLPPSNRIVPSNGVYATLARSPALANGQPVPSVTNIGLRPTFAGETVPEVRIEAHLLDTSPQDLYGQPFSLAFIDYLRPELRFANVADLLAQIQLDIQRARDVLNKLLDKESQ